MVTYENMPSASDIAALAVAGRLCIVSDIDDTLVLEDASEQPGLTELAAFLTEHRTHFLFAVATGRNLAQTTEVFDAHGLPCPDAIIASVGTEIFYAGDADADPAWSNHIGVDWDADRLNALDERVPGLRRQEPDRQRPHKVSFYVEADRSRASQSPSAKRAPWGSEGAASDSTSRS